MKIDNKNLEIQRVEVITRSFNSSGQAIKEQWEYYYPTEEKTEIKGFKTVKK
jgi:hypothetical protein